MPRRLRAWSYLRQRLGKATSGPVEALRDAVAVYSSHPTAPLSLLSRSESFDAKRLSEMEQRREVLRILAVRRSIFPVPAKTAPWIFAATRYLSKSTRGVCATLAWIGTGTRG